MSAVGDARKRLTETQPQPPTEAEQITHDVLSALSHDSRDGRVSVRLVALALAGELPRWGK